MRRPTIFSLPPLVLLLAVGVDPAHGQYQVEAVAGRPFGVGRIKVDLPAALYPQGLGAAGIQLSERNGRVHYPVVRVVATPDLVKGILGRSQRPLGRLLGEILDRPPKVEILFLFRGDAPLELTLVSGRLDAFPATPSTNAPADHRRLLRRWWREYTDTPGFWRTGTTTRPSCGTTFSPCWLGDWACRRPRTTDFPGQRVSNNSWA